MKYLFLLIFLYCKILFAQVSNFNVGDKWVYYTNSIDGANTNSKHLLQEVIKRNANEYGITTYDDNYNIYLLTRWHNNQSGFYIEGFGQVYDKYKADFDTTNSSSRQFLKTKTEVIFDTLITYQHWGMFYNEGWGWETKYSPQLGLLYQYKYDSTNQQGYTASLKAAKIGQHLYGDINLFDIWKKWTFPEHRSFQKGDKWIYKKYRKIYPDSAVSYVTKELIDDSGTLVVTELPGNIIWTEKWDITSNNAFISFTTNTFKEARREKVYDRLEKDYIDRFVPEIEEFVLNKEDKFLGTNLYYQHRLYDNFGYFRIPTPFRIETKYSPEIGLLYLYHHSSDHYGVYYNDVYTLEAAIIDGKLIGNEVLSNYVDKIHKNPEDYILQQNYPNPFNSETLIRYQVLQNGYVSLKVFNSIGEVVRVLVNEEHLKGEYTASLSAADLSSGVYFYHLQNGNSIGTKKLMILK